MGFTQLTYHIGAWCTLKGYYVGTDNEKYAYLKAADGTLVRVEVALDKESWKHTINGIDKEEIFDGLFYAG